MPEKSRNSLKKSILFRIGSAMAMIISLAFVGMFSSVFIAETSEGYAAAINQAGTLRMQSYRIASSLAHRPAGNTSFSIGVTRQLVEEFERRLTSERIHNVLSKESNPKILQAYHEVERQWLQNFRPNLESYIRLATAGTDMQANKHDLESPRQAYLLNVDNFVDAIHRFVKVLEVEAEAKIQQLRIIQIAALVLTLIVIMIVMWLIQQNVLSPLRELMAAARAVREGDFSLRIHTREDDELAQLGYAFNMMSENLSIMYSTLEDRVRQKTADLERTNRSLELLYMTTKRLSEAHITQEILTGVIHDIEKQIGVRNGTICLGKPGDREAYKMASTAPENNWNVAGSYEQDCERCFGSGDSHIFEVCKGTIDSREVFSTPIKDKDRYYGILLVELEKGKILLDWQQRLLETVASHVALAMNMAQNASQSRMLALSEERSVIARELHDSLAQSLSYLKIQVSRLENAISKDEEKQKTFAISHEIRDGLNQAYRQLRELLTTFRLRINEAGLASALEETVREFSDRGEVDIELVNRTANCKFTPNAEIHLIHIIREALSNIFQHAEATRAKVLLQCNLEGQATLIIEDNGIGISSNQTELHHYGLSIMKERTRGLGGEIDISQLPDGGTSIRITFII